MPLRKPFQPFQPYDEDAEPVDSFLDVPLDEDDGEDGDDSFVQSAPPARADQVLRAMRLHDG